MAHARPERAVLNRDIRIKENIMTKTIAQINEKIRNKEAVVVTAEEILECVKAKGIEKTAREVDVVTTGTFGPMCSSGAFVNTGHAKPRIKLGGGKVYFNDIPVYTGLAAVDVFIGATDLPEDDPRNRDYPGTFDYGGGHLIEDLVAGKDIRMVATAYGTDCYPGKHLETTININSINEAVLFNIRNAYQNYNVAVNLSDRVIYTYMGVLRPHLANANYSSAGQLSPLLNDPYYKTIGIGTKIFLGGGTGYIAWHGTQHNPDVPRSSEGLPLRPSGTLSVIGDLKQMKPEWLRGTSMLGYGSTLTVGIGVPIPVLSEEVLKYTLVRDADITAPIVDYSDSYPNRKADILGEVSYAELRTGKIQLGDKEVATGSLSSYSKAIEIASTLKKWITDGKFLLTEPVASIPGVEAGIHFKNIN